MDLSRSGKIVLIDDIYKEAEPIIRSLGKLGIPLNYYSGKVAALPDQPLRGMRFVFLDINLEGMEGQDDKTKASNIIQILIKIIPEDNGPYMIIFWTKHQEVIGQIIENCTEYNIPPIAWIDLEKTECINDQGEYDLDIIKVKLTEEMKKSGAFRLYVEWENILNIAGNEFIYNFGLLIKYGSNWSDETFILFYKLYKAYVEKNVLHDTDEQFRCASLLLNRSFADVLKRRTIMDLKIPDGIKLENGELDSSIIAKLNSYLHISLPLLPRPSSGNFYYTNNETLLKSLNNKLFKTGQSIPEARLGFVIITPECDLAQNKVLIHNEENEGGERIHRVVYGVLSPFDPEFNGKRKGGNDASFIFGPFWNGGREEILVFHFGTVTFIHEGDMKDDSPFSLSNDLLFDLQSKASNHVNRLGNFQL